MMSESQTAGTTDAKDEPNNVTPGDIIEHPCDDCESDKWTIDEINRNPGVDVAHTVCDGCGKAGFIYLG